MKFGLFYEHQLPRPWHDGDERRLYHEALEQIALADELGIDAVWEVEHHFLEEYSHSAAPEVFLAAAAAVTDDIRIGHGIRQMPPDVNPPARIAEQIATLDIVSDGRVEWGIGEGATRTELGGFNVDPAEKGRMCREATEQAADMMDLEPYPGHDGEFSEMPVRNVVPKPVQDPHPPLWMACSSRESIETAARRGVGALTFAFTTPDEAASWVDTYYETFREECVPIGRDVNPNVAMVTGFSCHEDGEVARDRGEEGLAFFVFALAYYVAFGTHVPGDTDLWEAFQAAGGVEAVAGEYGEPAIGTPERIRALLEGYEEAGVDQVVFLQQGGNTEHEHICASLELFAEEVMPAFHDRDADHVRAKRESLQPFVEAALERKEWLSAPPVDERPHIESLDDLSDLEARASGRRED